MKKSFSKVALASLIFVAFNAHASEPVGSGNFVAEAEFGFMNDSELSKVQGATRNIQWSNGGSYKDTAPKPVAQPGGSRSQIVRFTPETEKAAAAQAAKKMNVGLIALGVGVNIYSQHKQLTSKYNKNFGIKTPK